MPKTIDATGVIYGHLMVLKRLFGRKAIYICKCLNCYNFSTHRRSELVSNKAKSCGYCGSKSVCHFIHGFGHETAEYRAWCSMLRRCYNSQVKEYPRYGGRGITVCERWQLSFENFLWDMGLKPWPGLSLDRIDNNGNYEPSNCQWADKTQQANNRSKRYDAIQL